MGTVYRARDSRLRRDVAIKVLSEARRLDAARLLRFEQEARALAALSHPNIAAIYGIEETAEGAPALVLELVEGETLATRLALGALPLGEALSIAGQIAEALDAAHEKGIVHRDLKPANIAITSTGLVKVLDFGVAKIAEPSAASVEETRTSGLTHEGMVVGTAAYMSPEQARGQAVDRRTDIWAFGCVLYEMLTGRRLFKGDSTADTLAAVLGVGPDWNALPAETPTAVRTLLRRCLERDWRARIRETGTIRFVLGDGPSLSGGGSVDVVETRPAWKVLSAIAAGGLLLGGVLVAALMWSAMPPPVSRVTRLAIPQHDGDAIAMVAEGYDLAMTPDGSVVYAANGGTQLLVRALEALEPTVIASGGGLKRPFLSPSGDWVGFGGGTGFFFLSKVPIAGGDPVKLTAVDGDLNGATWLPDDTIVFATSNGGTGLQRISASGGKLEVLTKPDHEHGEVDHLYPDVLPGGSAVLFTLVSQMGNAPTTDIWAYDVRDGSRKRVFAGGSDARFVRASTAGAIGHLVYTSAGALHAIPFDVNRLEILGTPSPVVKGVATRGYGRASVAVASDGTLAYVEAPPPPLRTLVLLDRFNNEEAIPAPPRPYMQPRVSPDGTRIVVGIWETARDLWIWNVRQQLMSRLTMGFGLKNYPVWNSDGSRVFYASTTEGGALNIWSRAADGTGDAERITTSDNFQNPTGISPDGQHVVLHEATQQGIHLFQVTLGADHRKTSLVAPVSNETGGVISPDGRWLAFSQASEVYVRPYPDTASGVWPVSTDGGSDPIWSKNGKELELLFYERATKSLMRVPVEATAGSNWRRTRPEKLLDLSAYDVDGLQRTGSGRSFDVFPDGSRFVIVKPPKSSGQPEWPNIIVVQHFDQELDRLVRAGR